ncbi:MAG TPA: plastocyanin/azurin family copper-binding protein [Thermoplasmata archaeon]|nr:plastocyanin/azurin family copper-binding protein [Thermoplasmata archaeon]
MPVSVRSRTSRPAARRRRARTFVSLGLLLLLVVAFVRTAPPSSSAAPRAFATGGPGGGTFATNATLNLTDAPSYTPNSIAATSGTAVAVHLVNTGLFSHTFTVSSVANLSINRSWSPTQLNAFFVAHAPWVNASVGPNSSQWANFTIPDTASGSYEFVSVVPYQFQAGMAGFLNITASSPGAGLTLSEGTAASSLAFAPAVLQANATGYPVRISVAVSNLGSTGHTWTLVPQADVNLTPGNFSSYFSVHAPLASVTVPTTPGQVIWANFTIPKAGVYQFVCEIPGHFAAGMVGYLYVGVAPPAVAPPPSTAIVEPILLLGGGALLGIGAFLALSASLVGRFPPRAPSGHH